jgi:glutathione S-transferase
MPETVTRDLARLSDLWRTGLERFGGPFLAGAAFTAADAFFCPVAFRVQTFGLEIPHPEAAAYAARLLDVAAMREWYAGALAEPFRDPPHEVALMATCTVLEDLRAPETVTA